MLLTALSFLPFFLPSVLLFASPLWPLPDFSCSFRLVFLTHPTRPWSTNQNKYNLSSLPWPEGEVHRQFVDGKLCTVIMWFWNRHSSKGGRDGRFIHTPHNNMHRRWWWRWWYVVLLSTDRKSCERRRQSDEKEKRVPVAWFFPLLDSNNKSKFVSS